MELGRTDVALDVLAKRGDWDRLWEVAAKEKMASSTVAKFVVMRVEEVRTFVLTVFIFCLSFLLIFTLLFSFIFLLPIVFIRELVFIN